MVSTDQSKYRSFVRRVVFVGLLASATQAWAEVKLASPFTSHMVFQRDLPVPVWGWAEAAETVKVEFADQTQTATADANGQWRVDFRPLKVAVEPRALKVVGSKSAKPIVLEDVLVGEVWLASGQSNMVFTLSKKVESWAGVENEAQEIAAADEPQIRIFTAAPIRAAKPQAIVPGEWQVCAPDNAPGFSAVGYYFARRLHDELKVPVGIVTLAYGASTAQAWISREAIEANPTLKAELDRFDEKMKNHVPPTTQELDDWKAAVEKAKAEKKRPPGEPKKSPAQDQHNPTVLFNGVVAPVIPFAARGIIWYQGESITAPQDLFPLWNQTLVSDWRKRWGRELPFYFCQLAALDSKSNSPTVRAMQAEAVKLPNTAMVVTIDLGDRKNVHPKNKRDVGERLARVALARDYGRAIEYVGPQFDRAAAEGEAIRVTFSHADGLTAKSGPLKTFEVAGADGKYAPAEATIDGQTAVVKSSAVPEPVSVRYAWSNYPDGPNLYNAAGLPAAPFRSEQVRGGGAK